MKSIIEGGTKLLVHEGEPTKRMDVFFNPAKEFDRSLTVNVVKMLRPKRFLDLMSASGAKGVRVLNEAGVPVIFNDLNPLAVKLCRRNLKLNGLSAKVHNKSACQLLYDLGEFFDFIDLDPFGSPNPCLDACIKFTSRGGVLAVTATDSAALNGAKPEACFRKYHSRIKRHSFMKESGLRVLIKHVIEKGSEHEMALTPILAHCTKHYYRAYFRKDLGAKRCDDLLKQVSNIYYCRECGHRGFMPCKHDCQVIGPLFTGRINSLGLIPEWALEDEFPPWHFVTEELKLSQEPKMSDLLINSKAVKSHYEGKAFKTQLNFSELKRAKF